MWYFATMAIITLALLVCVIMGAELAVDIKRFKHIRKSKMRVFLFLSAILLYYFALNGMLYSYKCKNTENSVVCYDGTGDAKAFHNKRLREYYSNIFHFK